MSTHQNSDADGPERLLERLRRWETAPHYQAVRKKLDSESEDCSTRDKWYSATVIDNFYIITEIPDSEPTVGGWQPYCYR